MKFYIIVALIAVTVTGAFTKSEINWNDVKSADLTKQPLPTAPTDSENNSNDTENRSAKGRIIGGIKAVSIAQFNYQVGMLTNSRKKRGMFWCGGAIIAPRWVLSAGHCVADAIRGYLYMGCLDRTKQDSPCIEMQINTRHFNVHPKYDENEITFDISLIEIPRRVQFSEYINQIELYTNPYLYAGQNIVISGWGLTESGQQPDILNYANVKLLSRSECRKTFDVDESQVCQIVGSSKQSTCQGDSGGPWTMKDDGKTVLIGVTSFGPSIGCVNFLPRVATRVSYHVDWICDNTNREISVC